MNKHKSALLGWAVLYPLITVMIYLTEPLLEALPLPVQTLILTGLAVPLMDYLAMPAARRLACDWLRR